MDDFLVSDEAIRRFTDALREYAIVRLDPQGHVVSWNAGAQALKGYSAAEVIGSHFSRFYTRAASLIGHPERELAVAASLGRYEEQGWRVRKDGTQFWAYVVILPIYDDDMVLRGYGKVVRDYTEQKQSTEQSENVMKLLEFTARTDYLTGLDNRRSLDKELGILLSASRRHAASLSLGMADLDRFKGFNDSFGHQAGDVYLKKAATRWRATIRPEDFASRYGGEEFVIVLPNTELTGAIETMERVRTATPEPLTCSIGVAEWDGKESANELISRADRALYQAKETGRDKVAAALRPAARQGQAAASA